MNNMTEIIASTAWLQDKIKAGWEIKVLHRYDDGQGNTIFWKARLEREGAKHILPFHYHEEQYVLGEPSFADKKPLYNLPAIVNSEKEAIIWIVEGEKCVDALKALGVIATTSGGASSAQGADWQPLSHRKIILWPDHDVPGKNYAEVVSVILSQLGCSISMIDTDKLNLASRQDCVDWLRHRPAADSKTLLALPMLPYQSENSWPEVLPLKRELAAAPEFPNEALGEDLSWVAKTIAHNIQTPIEICGQSMLAAASLAVQGFANVEVDGRVYPLSCYFISVAESGDRKSAVDQVVLKPFKEHQYAQYHDYQHAFKIWQGEDELYQLEKKQCLAEQAKGKGTKNLEDPPVKPLEPILLVEEPTLEGLIKLFETGQPSMGMFSDEGARLLGGYSMKENLLKTLGELCHLWDSKPISRIRAGDQAVLLYGKRLALHLMVQPIVASTLLNNELANGQGFLSRCLISWPASQAGKRLYQQYSLAEHHHYQMYAATMNAILKTRLPLKDNTRNELAPRHIVLSKESKERYIAFHDEVEAQLGESGLYRPIKALASKAAEHALRLAGVLTLVKKLNAVTIEEMEMASAILLAKYYLAEALRIKGLDVSDSELTIAEKLLAWLRERKQSTVDLKAIYQYGPSMIRKAETARQMLRVLTEHGYVRPGFSPVDNKKKEVFEVNPLIFSCS